MRRREKKKRTVKTIAPVHIWLQPRVPSHRALPLDVQQQRRSRVENTHVLPKNLVDHRYAIPSVHVGVGGFQSGEGKGGAR